MTTETSNAGGEWVLVPRVPDADMLDAAVDAHIGFNGEDEVDAVWAAMLAAAPPPAAQQQEHPVAFTIDNGPGRVVGLEWNPFFPVLELRGRIPLYAAPPPAAARGDVRGLVDYDAGLLNDFGGGDVIWWQDYLRAEIERANEFWREQTEQALAAEGVQAGEVGKRARELLADAYAAAGFPESASDVRKGRNNYGALERASLSAIASALSQQPEARGVVDEVMVERAVIAYEDYAGARGEFYPGGIDREHIRAAVTAALTGDRNG